jgi:hypothetical protein
MKKLILVLLAAALVGGLCVSAVAATIVFPRIRPVTDPIVLQTTATTGAGNIVDLHHRLAYTNVWVFWNGTNSAGVVEVQVALTDAGPWKTVATLTHQNDLPDWVLLVGSPGAIRASITTTVVGGTVSAWVTGW